jgi:hypothetical protein
LTDLLVSPPRAPLAFRVSVVGHRPNRLPKNPAELGLLRKRVAAVLEAVQEAVSDFASQPDQAALYANAPPILRAISPLAEGSDRMFAEEALRLGYALCCPMPFAQADFEQDFAPGEALEPHSVDRFRGLLDQARSGAGLTVFELDGARTNTDARAEAYAAAARVVMNQSDLMIVIWDGGESAGAGGTVDTLHEAVRYRVPILWIDAIAPFSWTVVRSEADLACLDGADRCRPAHEPSADTEEEHRKIAGAVAKIVRREIALPGADAADSRTEEELKTQLAVLEEARAHGAAFFRERRPPVNLFFIWKLFRDVIGDLRFVVPTIRTVDFVKAIQKDWPTSVEEAPTEAARPATFWVNGAVRAHFAWSDRLADDYGDAYRTAFILSYLLAACAVFIALFPRAIGWTAQAQTAHNGDTIKALAAAFSVDEFAVLSAILALVLWGRSRRWHERWMEYRVLAELIRELRFLIPLGGGRPLPRTPTHLGVYGDPAQTWMYWHLRAIARAVGIPSVSATRDHLVECIDSLADVSAGQRVFHVNNYRRYEHLHNRLHRATLMIFGLTMASIAVQLAIEFFFTGAAGKHPPAPTPRADWLILLAGFLPALAAALAGIDNHGEFLRIAKRSRAMEGGFVRFGVIADGLRARLLGGGRVPLAEVTPLASKIAETMIDEVMDWRIVVLDRPQTAG